MDGITGGYSFLWNCFVLGRQDCSGSAGLTWYGDARHACLAIMAVLVADLVNAFFEVWLFAVGYYMCIFFWTLAFALIDLAPVTGNEVVRDSGPWPAPVRA